MTREMHLGQWQLFFLLPDTIHNWDSLYCNLVRLCFFFFFYTVDFSHLQKMTCHNQYADVKELHCMQVHVKEKCLSFMELQKCITVIFGKKQSSRGYISFRVYPFFVIVCLHDFLANILFLLPFFFIGGGSKGLVHWIPFMFGDLQMKKFLP